MSLGSRVNTSCRKVMQEGGGGGVD